MIFRRYSASNGNFTPADLFNINKSNGCAIIITGNTKYPQNLPLKIPLSTVVSSSCFKHSTYLAYFQAKRPSDSLPTTPPNKRHMRYLSSIDNHEHGQIVFHLPESRPATTVDGSETLAQVHNFLSSLRPPTRIHLQGNLYFSSRHATAIRKPVSFQTKATTPQRQVWRRCRSRLRLYTVLVQKDGPYLSGGVPEVSQKPRNFWKEANLKLMSIVLHF